MITSRTFAIALATCGLAAGTVTSSHAGLLPTITAAVTQAAPDHAIGIYWRGFGWRGYGGGLAAGALAGAAIAGPYYGGRSYYYGAPMPYYSRPVYAAPYAYAPAFTPSVYPGSYAPYGYYYSAPSRCYTQEGYGRYRPCSAN
jgi:hypothetical protein